MNTTQRTEYKAWANYRAALTRGPGGFRGQELAAWDKENPAPTKGAP